MLILTRRQIAALLTFDDYIEAVEQAFRAHVDGRAMASALMHVGAPEGEFHVKAGGLLLLLSPARRQFLLERLLVSIRAVHRFPRAAAGSGEDSAGENGMMAGLVGETI